MGRRVQRGFDRDLFRDAIKAAGVSRSDLARLADISPATIHSWERRGGTPDIERLARIAGVLGVEVTAFVHVPDDECLPSDLRNRRGLTQVQLAAAAGLSTTVVSGFERAETRWSVKKAEKLAPVLGVSVEQLHEAWQRSRTRPAGTPP
ncbi:helix-turn-helix domain-containing protein [Mycobacterium avium]|uniref:helix-turn-helix domain-containing protein n=1 Tax=Mycobacterium avium TaxID=1764 RepID=UPI0008F50DEA|nr:helix-turn-helix transcriptional regulator [Mycobacterium avium]APA78392.3 helix-turn-helix transcriptional regulator [Mycobacterium avium subsp. hominissuis]